MAGPTLTDERRAPSPRLATSTVSASRPSRPGATTPSTAGASRLRSQVRTQWFVFGAALTVLAGLLVAWGLSRAADRVLVVSVARPVSAGTELSSADLTTTAIAFDGAAPALVPAASFGELVGRTATVDLTPGVLLAPGMWADATALADNERLVGAVLEQGQHPTGLAIGSRALAVSLDDETDPVEVRVIDVSSGNGTAGVTTSSTSGAITVTLAVGDASAARIARLGAMKRLVLIGLPHGAVSGTTP